MEIVSLYGSKFPYTFTIYKEMVGHLSYYLLIHGCIKKFLNFRLWVML